MLIIECCPRSCGMVSKYTKYIYCTIFLKILEILNSETYLYTVVSIQGFMNLESFTLNNVSFLLKDYKLHEGTN